MANRHVSPSALTTAGREHALGLYRSHRIRVAVLVLVVLIALFGLFGFFAAPSIIKSQLQSRLSTQLGRPVTIGAIHLNPFSLKLDVDRLHIGERDGTSPFVDIDHLTIDAAWSSVLRMAPVLDALSLQHPQIHVTRLADQTFNFSDLVQRFASKPADPNAPPTRFALSNITVHDGDFVFDDKLKNTTHRVDHIELGIPFIANLSHDTDIFVQPLLAMQVDGSPIRIQGQTKPFASTRESTIDFRLDHLDLPRYLSYVPTPLPAAIPNGQLSGQLQLQFVDTKPTQQLRVQGQLSIDDFVMTTTDGKPMLELAHGSAVLNDVEPLLSRYRFGAIELEQAKLHYTSTSVGHSNIDALIGPSGKPVKADAPKTDAHIDSLTLKNSLFEFTDLSTPTPTHAVLDNLSGTITSLATLAGPPAHIDLSAGLAGGHVRLDGALYMSADRFTGQLELDHAGVDSLLAMAPPMLNAKIARGTLDANGQIFVDWSHALILRMDTGNVAVNDFALTQRGHTPVAWQSLKLEITHADESTSHAALGNVVLQGLKLNVQKLRNGKIDLASLSKPSPAHSSHTKQAPTPAWHWSIAHLGIASSTVDYKDENVPGKAGHIAVNADKFGIDDLSDNMHHPIKLDLAGGIGKGRFRVNGTVKPEPLDADVRIVATRLNVAPLESLVSVPLNVNIDSALLSAHGRARYRDRKPQALVSYQGSVTLGHVKVLDKVTGDDFLSWNSLSATGMSVRSGEGAPQIRVGGLALDNFYARVIVNSTGRLNIQDVVASPQTAPVSVTQANNAPAASKTGNPSTPTAASSLANQPNGGSVSSSSTLTPSSASTAAIPPAEIQIGEITLANGHLNYTDNFIKPNYTANITQLAGKIGAFGTKAGGPPADLTMQGQLDDNAPVTIDGTINPLAPVAFLDIKAKADGVELTHLSPYSTKYAGYPITKGRLTMNVHYLLDQGKLNADNHIFLTQLTFGDRVNGPGIGHLPVKLAVALLKDSNGDIDVDVPVTGSLSDPHFSLGSVIWHAFVNLITRAVTAPFRLLTGGGGGSHQDLGYVEFAPGSSVLDAPAQTKLTEIAKILNQKPSLKLDIIGRVDPTFDEKGLREVTMDDEILQELNDDRGGNETAAALAKLSPDDYNRYLAKAYKHAKFSKPRDFVGMTKSQPPDVMKKLLQANVPVDQDAYRHLGERRADAVRQWLHNKVADNRVFVLAPKLDTKGIDDKGRTTRVDFGLH